LDRIFGFNSDKNQYLNRLTVELIKASQALFGFDYLNHIGPMPNMTDERSRCKRTQEDKS
jgi:hypothetical protein